MKSKEIEVGGTYAVTNGSGRWDRRLSRALRAEVVAKGAERKVWNNGYGYRVKNDGIEVKILTPKKHRGWWLAELGRNETVVLSARDFWQTWEELEEHKRVAEAEKAKREAKAELVRERWRKVEEWLREHGVRAPGDDDYDYDYDSPSYHAREKWGDVNFTLDLSTMEYLIETLDEEASPVVIRPTRRVSGQHKATIRVRHDLSDHALAYIVAEDTYTARYGEGPEDWLPRLRALTKAEVERLARREFSLYGSSGGADAEAPEELHDLALERVRELWPEFRTIDEEAR